MTDNCQTCGHARSLHHGFGRCVRVNPICPCFAFTHVAAPDDRTNFCGHKEGEPCPNCDGGPLCKQEFYYRHHRVPYICVLTQGHEGPHQCNFSDGAVYQSDMPVAAPDEQRLTAEPHVDAHGNFSDAPVAAREAAQAEAELTDGEFSDLNFFIDGDVYELREFVESLIAARLAGRGHRE